MDIQSKQLITFLYRWRKPLVIIPLVAAVVAAVASMPVFIKPLYTSTVVVFPATTNSPSKALLPQTSYQDQDFLEFGAEEQAEQFLQILHSDAIFDSISLRYNLMSHYDIDSSSRYKRYYLREEFNDKFSFKRTQFMSVEIAVQDVDPQLAADMANEVSDLADRSKSRIQRTRARIGLSIVNKEYSNLHQMILDMEEEMVVIRFKGVHDYENQSMVITEQLAMAIAASAKQSVINELHGMLDTLAKYGSRYVSLRDELRLMKEEEVKMRTKLSQVKMDATQVLPATFSVNRAVPSDKKSYPVRWLVLLLAAIASFVATLLSILISTTWKDLRSELGK
ncbi:MAG: hypothetical protein HOE88_04705 [Flavobacteriales bacterium]|jgi:capsular polysaccharide biosynthesis protein|nr:hypothetical protein [Flavobacteriales bacterium]MBT3572745.1 hypothetical protein [Flavobacteriales bacterium]MBT3678566.1 hypothetical protein [Flavobacteriales bacterium]MBT3739388.1 hypothetical protein [Flavobacteriales bacterium]MBT4102659.1 hypothetical protein [Flavobacteriales bacterium]